MHDALLKPAIATGLGLVGLVSAPALSTFILQLTRREPRPDSYEDSDGKATPESLRTYSAKWPKTFVVLFALLATGSSIALAVLTTLNIGQDDFLLETWLCTAAIVSQPLSSETQTPLSSETKANYFGF